MLKEDFNNKIEDIQHCFICKKEFKKNDEIREIFDKSFNKTVMVHKHHYFFGEKIGNAL